MKNKTKVLLSSIATIAMTASLAVGGTYALFTSQDEVNISVSSGTVDVNANVNQGTVVMTSRDVDVTANKVFANGGSATWAEDTVTLNLITPGDKITFDIDITNDSNVNVLYRTIVSCVEGVELFAGLKVSLDYANDQAEAQVFDGMTAYGAWKELAVSNTTAVDTVKVTVEFPYLATSQNEYQGLSTKIAFAVEAVQGNADVTDDTAAAGETLVYSANDLKLVSMKAAKGYTFKNETVKLASDIDLGATASTFAMRATPVKNWTPIQNFAGTFDGQDHTISNLVSIEEEQAGLIAKMNEATVKNVNVKNAYVSATSYAGVIVGMGYTGKIENCHVSGLVQVSGNYMVGGINGHGYAGINNCSVVGAQDSYVTGIFVKKDLEGDNVGGIAGHIAEGNTVSNCKVSGIAVSGTRKVGGIVGIANGGSVITNAVVENVTVKSNADETYLADNASKIFVGGVLGEYNGNVTVSGSISNAEIEGLVGKTDTVAGGSREANAVVTKNVTVDEDTVAVSMEDQGVEYIINDGEVYLYNAAGFTGDVYVIPEGVATIGGSAFSYCNVKKVVMPSTLRNVKINAFKNSPVEEVVLNEGLTELGERAFSQAINLKKVTFPSTLTTLGLQAFRLAGMEEITLTAGLVNIGEGAFRDMANLTTVTIENDATLANYAFRSCPKLQNVYIKGDVTFTGTSQVFTTGDNAAGKINVYVMSEEMKTCVQNANASTGASLNIIVMETVNNNADLSGAMSANGNVLLGAGEFTLPGAGGKDVSVTGTKDTEITIDKPAFAGADVTLNGVTVIGKGYSTGIQHVNAVTYNNVTVKGSMCLYGEKVVFNNCTFELVGDYIWVYAAKNVEFNNCTFNTTGKAILVYNEGACASNVLVKGCTFNATAGAKAGAIANQNCAAIEIDNTAGMAHKVTTQNNTYSDNFSGEWRIKNYVSTSKITVNGVEYASIAIDGKTMTIDANKNVTVNG